MENKITDIKKLLNHFDNKFNGESLELLKGKYSNQIKFNNDEK